MTNYNFYKEQVANVAYAKIADDKTENHSSLVNWEMFKEGINTWFDHGLSFLNVNDESKGTAAMIYVMGRIGNFDVSCNQDPEVAEIAKDLAREHNADWGVLVAEVTVEDNGVEYVDLTVEAEDEDEMNIDDYWVHSVNGLGIGSAGRTTVGELTIKELVQPHVFSQVVKIILTRCYEVDEYWAGELAGMAEEFAKDYGYLIEQINNCAGEFAFAITQEDGAWVNDENLKSAYPNIHKVYVDEFKAAVEGIFYEYAEEMDAA